MSQNQNLAKQMLAVSAFTLLAGCSTRAVLDRDAVYAPTGQLPQTSLGVIGNVKQHTWTQPDGVKCVAGGVEGVGVAGSLMSLGNGQTASAEGQSVMRLYTEQCGALDSAAAKGQPNLTNAQITRMEIVRTSDTDRLNFKQCTSYLQVVPLDPNAPNNKAILQGNLPTFGWENRPGWGVYVGAGGSVISCTLSAMQSTASLTRTSGGLFTKYVPVTRDATYNVVQQPTTTATETATPAVPAAATGGYMLDGKYQSERIHLAPKPAPAAPSGATGDTNGKAGVGLKMPTGALPKLQGLPKAQQIEGKPYGWGQGPIKTDGKFAPMVKP